MGYSIYPAFQGQGLASEAAEALTVWALAQPGVRRVRATIPPDNLASQRVAAHAGLHRTGRTEIDEDVGLVEVWETNWVKFRSTVAQTPEGNPPVGATPASPAFRTTAFLLANPRRRQGSSVCPDTWFSNGDGGILGDARVTRVSPAPADWFSPDRPANSARRIGYISAGLALLISLVLTVPAGVTFPPAPNTTTSRSSSIASPAKQPSFASCRRWTTSTTC